MASVARLEWTYLVVHNAGVCRGYLDVSAGADTSSTMDCAGPTLECGLTCCS